MATIHKQQLSILGGKTRSVMVYSSSAAIVRDIAGVVVKPGLNEYTINHFSGNAQGPSFHVEGHGIRATITDRSIELVSSAPPAETPSEDTDADADTDSDTDSEDHRAIRAIDEEYAKLDDDREALDWKLQTSLKKLVALELYGRRIVEPVPQTEGIKVEPTKLDDVVKFLQTYANTREETGVLHELVRKQAREIPLKTKKLEKKKTKLQKRLQKQQKMKHARQEVPSGSKKTENILYPYYRLRVTVEAENLPLDAPSVEVKVNTGKLEHLGDDAGPKDATGPSLRVSYVISNARWESRHDLRIDTIARTGTLSFRAATFNNSGETWRDAKVTLSTVRTKYSLFSEHIPQLSQWKIGLGTSYHHETDQYSRSEWAHRQSKHVPEQPAFMQPAFGILPSGPGVRNAFGQKPATSGFGGTAPTSGGLFGGGTAPTSGGLFGGGTAPTSGGLFGGGAPASSGGDLFGGGAPAFGQQHSATPPTAGSLFGSTQPPPAASIGDRYANTPETVAPALPYQPGEKMSMATSVSETYGITTTFALPGLKTISSSSTPLHFLVAETALEDMGLLYTAIPKLRLAAYLTAAFKLPIDAPVLPKNCNAGLNVDGAFVGRIVIPQPDDAGTISVPLGVDETLDVFYDTPSRKSEVKGLFSKDETITYARAWEVKNRRSQTVELIVRDQISIIDREGMPVRMELTIKKPKSFAGFWEGVNGSCMLREGGQIEWRVRIEPGEKRREELEWDVLAEKGDYVVVSLS
ncbi:hypothetical protein BZA05DRAFT_347902 [Tricharina praecox]|uniref:uncharacterized protein n=1 Tax=Tricharina praecox TaxID=43433 RepID=UPI00221F4B8C|nr:uncharacterized protein BZA05DRAFT_347902 [Tricharina praecox]KAI5856829.1 hypothetical protein BZA05DRAFT_347902 [Tricharina praecox]